MTSNRSIWLRTCPNFDLFHADRFVLQLSKQLEILAPSGLYKPSIHASLTTLAQRGSLSHIASKRKGGWQCFWHGFRVGRQTASMEWSDVDIEKWCTMVPGKFLFHAVMARARSRRMWIRPSVGWFRDHVKGEPI